MNNGIKIAIGSILGAGCGFAIGFFVAKSHYEAKADKEIATARNIFNEEIIRLYSDYEDPAKEKIKEDENDIVSMEFKKEKAFTTTPESFRQAKPTQKVDYATKSHYTDYTTAVNQAGYVSEDKSQKEIKEPAYIEAERVDIGNIDNIIKQHPYNIVYYTFNPDFDELYDETGKVIGPLDRGSIIGEAGIEVLKDMSDPDLNICQGMIKDCTHGVWLAFEFDPEYVRSED